MPSLLVQAKAAHGWKDSLSPLIFPSQGKQDLLGNVESELSTTVTLTHPYPGGGGGGDDTSTRSLLSAGLESSHASGTSKSSDCNYRPSSESAES